MAMRSGGRSSVLIGLVAGVLVFAMAIAGFLVLVLVGDHHSHQAQGSAKTSSAQHPTGRMPAVPAALARFYDQKLTWHQCTGGFCTTLTVPLDYAHPRGQALKLAVIRVPATDPSKKVGDLVVNPGGPGGSGVQYAQAASVVFRPALTEHFDVIGFDPRGVGASDPLRCMGTKALDRFVAANPAPSTAAGRARLDAMTHAYGESCLRRSGDLARHMSTVEVARDIDVLRGALGQPRLDYFGASYGTFIGATYANLFPHHVGRMVLDGALDPKLSTYKLSLQQAHGFEVALRAYVASCVAQKSGCVLGRSVDAATARIKSLLASITRNPLDSGDPSRPLTVGLATLGLWMPLYDKSWWPQLTAALTQAIEQHEGSGLLRLADLYVDRGPHGYLDNDLNALYDVNCLDHDDYIATSQVPSHFAAFEHASPTFGKDFAFSLSTCAAWPIKTHAQPRALHAEGAPPIVVMGTTRDPATPIEWARGLASELDSGVLVVRNGDGHTGYNQGNTCADEAVENYLVSDKVPKNGLVC